MPRAVASRRPKAPLPPRVSQPDKVEAPSIAPPAIISEPPPLTIELESSPGLPPVVPRAPASARSGHAPRPRQPSVPPRELVASAAAPAKSAAVPAKSAAPTPAKSVAPASKDVTKPAVPSQKPREPASSSSSPPTVPPPLRAGELVQAYEKLHKKLGEGAASVPPSSPSVNAPTETVVASDPARRNVVAVDASVVPSARHLAEEMGSRAPSPEASPSPAQPASGKGTAPVGALNLKPGTAVLAPGRTPAAIAVVVGSSLRINAHGKQAAKVSASVPPPVPMGRPSTAPKGFTPSGSRPPGAHDRRPWSSPAIAEEAPAVAEKAPVTYQVYTAQDISAGRGPMRTLVAIPPEPKKMSVGARVGAAVVGGLVVLLTAAAVIAVSTEDPKHPAPSGSVAGPRVRISATSTVTAAPEPASTTLSIGDPSDDVPPIPTQVTPTAPVVRPKPRAPTAPPSVKAGSPPPNPYGK